jgi:hypothetical protein
MTTTNLGLFQLATTSPDYENGNSPVAQLSAALATLDAKSNVAVYNSGTAIAITQGLVVLTKTGSLAAMTLAKPVAGLPSASTPGNDGQTLRVVSTTAYAHTITTPANGINGGHTVITFTAAYDFVELTAYNGTWVFGATNNVTVTT